jgi:hypothetical protein
VEKIVLLCFLMAVIGVLAEWCRARPKPPAPAGILALVLDRPNKRRQRRIQRRARIAIPRPIIPPQAIPGLSRPSCLAPSALFKK